MKTIKSEINWTEVLQKVNDPRRVKIPASRVIVARELEDRWPQGLIYVCDAYVEGIEHGREVIGGYQSGRIINIDHHAPTITMSKIISSTPLAIERVRSMGSIGSQDRVVINHDDCDSVLCSSIALGILPPLDEFGLAAIAADHTGEENPIADLLQACAKMHDVAFSIRNLAKILQGKPLDPGAEVLYRGQLADRAKAKQVVDSGKVNFLPSGLAWVEVDSVIDGSYFVSLLPQAKVILLVGPHRDKTKKRMGIRRGLAAPDGTTLHHLPINSFDPNFGGRWNAGSNNRGGGTSLSAQEYALQLDELVGQHMV